MPSDTASTLDSVKPGETITLSVTKRPNRESAVKTLQRLMRQDLEVKRALRRAQRRRRKHTPVKIRGGRFWYIREEPAKVVRVEPGAEWEMTYIPHLRDDLASVAPYIDVKKA